MFGYVNLNRKELPKEEQEVYQSYYCGLCLALERKAGAKGQLLLSFDLTFLVVLLTGLYELEPREREFRCKFHPLVKHRAFVNEATEYAADMNLVLAYHNLLDDWRDDHSYPKKVLASLIEKDYNGVKASYPRQVAAVERFMERTARAEQRMEADLDIAASYTGEMMGELFNWREDAWEGDMRTLGFYLGKFIYLMDAYEDVERDRKRGTYNPLIRLRESAGQKFDGESRALLTGMMAECAGAFERLPILVHADILRNILYSGVWTRFEYVRLKREKFSNPPRAEG